MGEKSEQARGRVKEAGGVLTGDTDLESEGKADRRAGEAKEKVGHVKDKVEAAIGRPAQSSLNLCSAEARSASVSRS